MKSLVTCLTCPFGWTYIIASILNNLQCNCILKIQQFHVLVIWSLKTLNICRVSKTILDPQYPPQWWNPSGRNPNIELKRRILRNPSKFQMRTITTHHLFPQISITKSWPFPGQLLSLKAVLPSVHSHEIITMIK